MWETMLMSATPSPKGPLWSQPKATPSGGEFFTDWATNRLDESLVGLPCDDVRLLNHGRVGRCLDYLLMAERATLFTDILVRPGSDEGCPQLRVTPALTPAAPVCHRYAPLLLPRRAQEP